MLYRFGAFELDTQAFVLRQGAAEIHVEPLVFDLLCCFLDHAGQVLTREAIIRQVWRGRLVSDATVSSAIKSARKALGDCGKEQTYIRTVRGRGFQFVGAVSRAGVELAPNAGTTPRQLPAEAEGVTPPAGGELLAPPRIAVLPIFPLPADPDLAVLGDALAQEVILELSRLHWLFVIARASSFQFRGQEIDLARASHVLGATYFVTGTIMREGGRCVVAVELCRTPGNNVIWAERFTAPLDGLVGLRSTLAGEIVSAMEPRIQLSEALVAAKLPTEHLGAWAAYHRGLWHMYRFNKRDNALAQTLFTRAVELDPGFARAHAGLSFTHFQTALLGFLPDAESEKRRARAAAERCMELDPLDPFANLTMGRTEWISGNLEAGLRWMERSIALRPSYAFAIYNSALVGTLLGEGEANENLVARAISLSPIDPLNYAMLATRALTHVVRADFAEAAAWANRAVRSPNAHVQIYTIAAFTNELAGKRGTAEDYVAHIRQANPAYAAADFLKSFPLREGSVRRQVEQSLRRLRL